MVKAVFFSFWDLFLCVASMYHLGFCSKQEVFKLIRANCRLYLELAQALYNEQRTKFTTKAAIKDTVIRITHAWQGF